LIAQDQRVEGVRQCKDGVKVRDREEVGLAVGHPLRCGEALALGTVPIATGVVTDAFRPTAQTLFDMPPSAAVRQWARARKTRACSCDTGCVARNAAPYARTISATSKGGGARWTGTAGAVEGDDSGSIGYLATSTSGKCSSGDPWAVR
jgi:hypothetical protein